MHQINHLNLGQKEWLEINDDSRGTLTPIVKLDLEPP